MKTSVLHCLLYLVAAILLCSCATNSTRQTARYPVEWFPGFALNHLLAQSPKLESTADIKKALSAPWYSPFHVHPTASHGQNQSLVLASCTEYLTSSSELRPDQPASWMPFMITAKTCQAARLILSAKPSKRSYVRKLAFQSQLPDVFPAGVALAISPSAVEQRERAIAMNARWSDVARHISYEPCKTLSEKVCGIYHDNSGGTQRITLVARGDFNGDGVEDLLVSSRDSVSNGSYATYRMFVLTRLNPHGKIKMIRQIQY